MGKKKKNIEFRGIADTCKSRGERKMALNATQKKKQFNITLDPTCKTPVENVTSSKSAHNEVT